jgi:hypothetical protein
MGARDWDERVCFSVALGLKKRETPGVRGLQHHRVVMTLVSLGTL